jgi:hypothetical protein
MIWSSALGKYPCTVRTDTPARRAASLGDKVARSGSDSCSANASRIASRVAAACAARLGLT